MKMLFFIYFIIVWTSLLKGTNSNHVYYVIPTTGNQTCPTGQVCHNISYYTYQFVFPSNMTFIFLEGRHELTDDLHISGLDNIVLKGESLKHQLPASVIITCPGSNNINISFVDVLQIYGLTIHDCSELRLVKMYSLSLSKLRLVSTSMKIETGFNDTNISITNSLFVDFYKTNMWIKISGQFSFINYGFKENINISHCNFVDLYFVKIYFTTVSMSNNIVKSVNLFGIHAKVIKIFFSIFDNLDCNTCEGLSLGTTNLGVIFIYHSIIQNTAKFSDESTGALNVYCEPGIIHHSIIILLNVLITNNTVTGIDISGSCDILFFNTTISNNYSPHNGGGMFITDGSIGGSSVYFINNKAKGLGGAIYFSNELNNNCQTIKNTLHLSFVNNLAELGGNNVYGGDFTMHSGNSKFSDIVDCHLSGCKRFQKSFPTPYSSYVTSDPLGVCICNGSVDCSIRSLYKQIYPGQLITLSLVIVGECGGISPGKLLAKSNGVDVVLLGGSLETEKTCKVFSYQLKQSYNAAVCNKGNVEILFENRGQMEALPESSFVINITFLPCPVGFELTKSKLCECNDVIKGIGHGNAQCNISLMPHPISRSGNNWLYYNHQHNCTVAYEHCPFDYCIRSTVSLNLNESDLQCTYNRSGTLCGQCQSGLSLMLGSNQCGHCSNYYLFLLPLFIIAGIGLIFMLLTLNLTVSVGTINGLLFYANILKLNEPVLFPNISIPVLTQFVSWLNLDFGFNVCFFNGLNGYWKTWLQFTFSLTLIVFIIVCCRYSGRLSRLFGKNVVSVLSTLILMAHSKLLLTIRNALMISPIKCNNFYWNVWSVDGNIEYLSGKHIPLFVISLLFLLTGLIYTVVIFCSQWLQQYSGKYCSSRFDPYVRLKPFIDSYTGPYKDKYRFWTGLLLIVRLIVTAVFAYTTGSFPQVNNYITMFVCVILLSFLRGKYRDKKNTILEFFFVFNLFITSLLNAVSDHIGFNIKVYINGVSIGLSLAVFIGTVINRVFILVRKKYKSKNNLQPVILQEPSFNDDDLYSPAHVVSRREPLIFDFDKVID